MPDPDEVQLAREVMGCRDCSAHWVNPQNFGPFVRCSAGALRAATAAPEPLSVVSFDQPSPAMLHGCRKAPVMQIGINPNLTGFFTLPVQNDKGGLRSFDGPRAVYPHFESEAAYALHHRYVHLDASEFRMDWASVVKLWDAGTVLRSTQAGEVLPIPFVPLPTHPAHTPDPYATSRRQSERRVQIQLRLVDGSAPSTQHSWTPLQNFAVGVPVVKVGEKKSLPFVANQPIAGAMTEGTTLGQIVSVQAVGGSSYFKNAAAMFSAAGLVPGEDVSMHDMVACATPGWSEEKYGISQDEFHTQCVRGHQYTARQIRQSQPVLLVFSGLEAYQMFLMNFGDYVAYKTPVANDMRETGWGGRYKMEVPAGTYGNPDIWICDILVLSHFSFPVERDGKTANPDPRIQFFQDCVDDLRKQKRLPALNPSSKEGKKPLGTLARNPGFCEYCDKFGIPEGCAYRP